MDFSTEKICNRKQARIYFTAMGCTHFHMAREYPERYAEYQKLHISQNQERTWTRERFHSICKTLPQTETDRLWSQFAEAASLAASLKEYTCFRVLLEATEKILPLVPSGFRILIAETILGRQTIETRNGLVFLSFDLGFVDEAKQFLHFAFSFANSDMGPKSAAAKRVVWTLDRKQAVIEKCKAIQADLNFFDLIL